jgi:lambda repressor-like predicted transcriptional regulator
MLGDKNQQRDDYRAARSHLDHKEIERMHKVVRMFRNDRWTPLWAQSDKKVRLVAYHYLCGYISGFTRQAVKPGTSVNDLEAIARGAARDILVKRENETSSEKTRLVIKEHLRVTETGIVGRIVGLLYGAYREKLTAVDLAERYETTHGSVRQTLYRLNKIAKRLFPAEECLGKHWSNKPEREIKKSLNARVARHRSHPLLVPNELMQAIAVRYNAGEHLKVLAAEHGMALSTLSWKLRHMGLKAEGRMRKMIFPDDKLNAAIAEKYNAGEYIVNIAKELGVSPEMIGWRIWRFGLKAANRPKPPNRGRFSEKTISVTPELLEMAYWKKHGALYRELAAIAGVSTTTLRVHLITLGLV